ncbi:hypothetical protein Tco_0378385, partial [Tanacetum coccineum]
KDKNEVETEADQEEKDVEAEANQVENVVQAETDMDENDAEAETYKEEIEVETEVDKGDNAESDQEDEEVETKPEIKGKLHANKSKTKGKKSAMTDPANRRSKERLIEKREKLQASMDEPQGPHIRIPIIFKKEEGRAVNVFKDETFIQFLNQKVLELYDEVGPYRYGERSSQFMSFRIYDVLGHYTVPKEKEKVRLWLNARLAS